MSRTLNRWLVPAASLVSGVLFSLGLGISGMTRPGKVVGFLDVTGAWDPSLIFVMAAAVAVYALASRFVLKRPAPLWAEVFSLPTRRDLTPRLVGGSMLFGVGWGLAGFCPGPALTSVVTGAPAVLVFLATMTGGMRLVDWLDSRAAAPTLSATQTRTA